MPSKFDGSASQDIGRPLWKLMEVLQLPPVPGSKMADVRLTAREVNTQRISLKAYRRITGSVRVKERP
jgi:hypothetical protein